MNTALENIAGYAGKVDAETVRSDCQEIMEKGPRQAVHLLQRGLTDPAVEATLTSAHAHLSALVKKQLGENQVPATNDAFIVAAYTSVKSTVRAGAEVDGEIPEAVAASTRTLADLCAQCHQAAARLLQLLPAAADSESILDEPAPHKGDASGSTADLTDAAKEAAKIIKEGGGE